jgi:hypothetical protein
MGAGCWLLELRVASFYSLTTNALTPCLLFRAAASLANPKGILRLCQVPNTKNPGVARAPTRVWGVIDWHWVPTAHRPVSVTQCSCVSMGFRSKKSGPRVPRPPGATPVLGSLVRSAEGLPSTRNWPFRWPLPPTSPPQVISKAM